MSLMTLVRMIGALAVGWTLVAIGIGAAGARLDGPETADPLVCESPAVDAAPATWPGADVPELIDRTNGQRAPIRLPEGHHWSMVSVSPWRVPGGELEAVGRWVRREEDEFCGWGLFRLTDGALLSRVATEVLPMGRPCWVPGHRRTIVFPAGDGRLYRCRLLPFDQQPVRRQRTNYGSGRAEPSDALVWEAPPPGDGEVFLQDPVWPDVPRLRKWVFVGLRQQERRHGRLGYGPSRLWWLEMSDDAGTIVAAGPLTPTAAGDIGSDRVEQRFPNVAVGLANDLHLVHLERAERDKPWRLRSSPIEFDAQTGRPRVLGGGDAQPPGPGADLQGAPLVVSADGMTVYGLSRSGELAALPAARRLGGPVGRERQK